MDDKSRSKDIFKIVIGYPAVTSQEEIVLSLFPNHKDHCKNKTASDPLIPDNTLLELIHQPADKVYMLMKQLNPCVWVLNTLSPSVLPLKSCS